MIALVVLGVSGTAFAATQLWDPVFGTGDSRPEIAQGPPPETQARALQVFRRPAAAPDRAADVQRSAALVRDDLNQGVYPETLRKIGETPDGQAIILYAAQRYRDKADLENPAPYTVKAPICVIYPGPAGFFDNPCWTPAQINANRANVEINNGQGSHLIGLAPDEAAQVTLTARDGQTLKQRVTDNFYDFANPAGQDLITGATVTWQAADGTDVPLGASP